MKKNLLLIIMCVPALLPAQNGVTVSSLVVRPGSPSTVTFDVSWDKATMPPEAVPWSDSVWVFVDYNEAGVMKRLPVTAATATAGTAIKISGNDQGVWIVGNARTAGNFSAAVQLFSDIPNIAGACAYASNYPPVGKWKEDGSGVSFTGTPNYTIWLENTQSGVASSVTSGKDFIISPGYVITSFTDKTGAPGTFLCIPPAAPTVAKGEFCYEQSGELVASASGSVTIEWYNALTGGTFLHAGEVLSLPPLYNTSAQYYAQAVAEGNCRSVRVKAEYTVSNCEMSGDCPGYTAGNVGANTTPAACAVHYAGQIGVTGSSASSACVVHDAGRISGGPVICDPPTAPTSIGASTLTAYAGQEVTLTATGGDNGSGAQYEWGSGAAGTGSSVKTAGNTHQVSPVTTTAYWVRRVSTAGCGAPTAAVTVTITIVPFPPGYPESPVCPGYIIGAIGTSGAGSATAEACALHYAGQIGVTGSSASSACVVHDAGRISGGSVICNPPTAPTSIGASTLTAYAGQAITLTATGGDNGSGAQYEWGTGIAGTGSSVKTTANTHQVSPVTTTAYWVRRVSTAGCGAPTAAVTVTITIVPFPPDYPVSPVCPGYVIGSVGTSGAGSATAAACVTHYAGQIGITGSSASSACVEHDAGRINGGSVICTPPTAPTSIGASTLTAYAGQVVTLTATGGDNGSGAQYEWGSGAVGTGSGVKTTANTHQVSPVTTTTYWARRVSTAGCGAPTAVATVTIIIVPFPPGYPVSEVCPGYIIGAIGTSGAGSATAAACVAHYTGQTGSTPATCVAHNAGRIGQ